MSWWKRRGYRYEPGDWWRMPVMGLVLGVLYVVGLVFPRKPQEDDDVSEY